MAEPKMTLNVLTKFIKPYNGDRETLPGFLTNCDNAISLCPPDLQNFLYKYILSQLEGKAQLACSLKDFNSWQEIKIFLKSTFGEKKHSSHLLHDLQNCRQIPSESVTQYGLRVEACLTRLHADIQFSCENKGQLAGRIAAMEDLALNTFMLGLNPNITTIVRCRNPLTLNEAINLAVEEEKILKLSKVSSFTTRQSKNCTTCHKTGHLASECFTKNIKREPFQKSYVVQPSTSFSPSQNNPPASSSVICAYCKHPGHHINDCRKRQYNNQRRSNQNVVQPKPQSSQIPQDNQINMCEYDSQYSSDSEPKN